MKRIPLRARDGAIRAHALVDDEDYERVCEYRWFLSSGYAVRNVKERGRWTTQRLHRLLLRLDRGDLREGDHENGDTLDNRRGNLRIVTHAQNGQNVHVPLRGAYLCKRTGRWRAQVKLRGVAKTLGRYPTAEEAAAVAADYRQGVMSHATS